MSDDGCGSNLVMDVIGSWRSLDRVLEVYTLGSRCCPKSYQHTCPEMSPGLLHRSWRGGDWTVSQRVAMTFSRTVL